MLEKHIEKKCIKFAESLGWLQFKVVNPTCNGLPDRQFITPTGLSVFVEFKTPKGRLSEIQRYQIARLKEMNAKVHVVNSVEGFKEVTELYQ